MGTGCSARRTGFWGKIAEDSSTAERRPQLKARRSFGPAVSDARVNEVRPVEFLLGDQTLVVAGVLWKLNAGASPKEPAEWMKRSMWLTSAGMLYYYSFQFCKPLGCSVIDLRIEAMPKPLQKLYAIELQRLEDGAPKGPPTILAASTPEERDEWFKRLISVKDQGLRAENYEQYGRMSSTRKRLNSHTASVDPAHKVASQLDADAIRAFGEQLFSLESLAAIGDSAFGDSDEFILGTTFTTDSYPSEGPCIFQSGTPSIVEQSTALRTTRRSSKIRDVEKVAKMVRRNSQLGFGLRENTVLVLDWDDTIFPTTFIREDLKLDWRRSVSDQVEAGPGKDELKALLQRYSEKVSEFLAVATAHAHVVIVTLARHPWVTTSAKHFMPCLGKWIEDEKINVVYARDCIPADAKATYEANLFKSPEEESEYWSCAKAYAMEQEISSFYKGNGGRWKNIISFGDSDFERVGLVRAAAGYVKKELEKGHIMQAGLTTELVSKDGHLTRLRTKTLKMVDEPSIYEMMAEVAILARWLPYVVEKDEGLDIVIQDTEDNASLCALNKEITGDDQELTWTALAGISIEEMTLLT